MSQLSPKHAAVIDAIAGRYPDAKTQYQNILAQLETLVSNSPSNTDLECLVASVKKEFPTFADTYREPPCLQDIPPLGQLALVHVSEYYPELPLQWGLAVYKITPLGNWIFLLKPPMTYPRGTHFAPRSLAIWPAACETDIRLQLVCIHEAIHDLINPETLRHVLVAPKIFKNVLHQDLIYWLSEGLTQVFTYEAYAALAQTYPDFYAAMPGNAADLLCDAWRNQDGGTGHVPENAVLSSITYPAATAVGYTLLQLLGKQRLQAVFMHGQPLTLDEWVWLKRPLLRLSRLISRHEICNDFLQPVLGYLTTRYLRSDAALSKQLTSLDQRKGDCLPFDAETQAIEQELKDVETILHLIVESRQMFSRTPGQPDFETRLSRMLSTRDGWAKLKDKVPHSKTISRQEKITFIESSLGIQLTPKQISELSA